MSVHAVKIFLKVAQLGSMRNAALQLGLTPSAVTKALQRFESEHGCKLTESSGNTFQLTPLGTSLLPLAERFVQGEKAIADCIRRHEGHEEHSVAVQCSESFGAYHMPKALVYFSGRHPSIRLECSLCHNDESLRNTLEMKNDLSIVSAPAGHPELETIPLFTESLVFIIPSDKAYAAIQGDDPWRLHGKSAIVHEKGAFPRKAFEQFMRETGIHCPIRMELSNNEAIRQSVLAGLGIALVSPAVVHDDIATGRLRPLAIKHPVLQRTYCIVLNRSRHHSRSVLEFVESLRSWSSEFITDSHWP